MMKMHVLLGVVVLQLASVQSFTPTTRLNKYSHGSIKSPASSRSTTSQSVVMSLLSDPDMVHSLFSDHALTVAEGIRDVAIFKGKTLSLLHPVMMFGLLGLSLSTGLLGLQWRRQRTLGDEISSLKKTMPPVDAESDAPPSPAALEIQAKVDALTAERKQLAAEGPRDKHFSQGALLAFLGTFFAIEGPLNTYARAGKLFPGPHLYAGAGLVILWAMAVSTIPAMQKGSDTARAVHIGANVVGTSLFAWQVVSGIPILLKVWEKTQWP